LLQHIDFEKKTLLYDHLSIEHPAVSRPFAECWRLTATLTRRRGALGTTVEAPMVGKILKVEKQVGDHVEEDEVVMVMEAMKMEIPIVAPVTGTLKELKVSPGQAVEAEQALAVID